MSDRRTAWAGPQPWAGPRTRGYAAPTPASARTAAADPALNIDVPATSTVALSGTAFDANEAALCAVLAEWTSARSYTARVSNLTGTGTGSDFANRLNGSTYLRVTDQLATTTVFDDNSADVLTGTSGQDWFFANLWGGGVLDRITDLSAAEFANDLTVIQGPWRPSGTVIVLMAGSWVRDEPGTPPVIPVG